MSSHLDTRVLGKGVVPLCLEIHIPSTSCQLHAHLFLVAFLQLHTIVDSNLERSSKQGNHQLRMLRVSVMRKFISSISCPLSTHPCLVAALQLRLRESPHQNLGPKELSYCALRTQLTMSLHDSQSNIPMLKRVDSCYELTWTLDAVLQQKRLSDMHYKKLSEMFDRYLPVVDDEDSKFMAQPEVWGEKKRGKGKTGAQMCGGAEGEEACEKFS